MCMYMPIKIHCIPDIISRPSRWLNNHLNIRKSEGSRFNAERGTLYTRAQTNNSFQIGCPNSEFSWVLRFHNASLSPHNSWSLSHNCNFVFVSHPIKVTCFFSSCISLFRPLPSGNIELTVRMKVLGDKGRA